MGLLSSIFGGSSQKSSSGNKNLDLITGMYSPMAQGGIGAYGTLGQALGIGGDFAGQQEAYENFLNNSGYDYVLDQGMQGVTNSAAGNYLLRSGSTAKALQDRSINIGKTFFENYLDRLSDMSRVGLGAGGLISDVGQYSKGKASSSSGGLGKAIGAGLAIFSDRRLKMNIEKVDEYPDGLGIYEWEYKRQPGMRFRGVMADEVKDLRPQAYVENYNGTGFAAVNYGAL